MTTKTQLAAIANAAIQSFKPAAMRVRWITDWKKARTIWHSNDPAAALTLDVPKPNNPTNLFVLLHELGHVVDSDAHPEVKQTVREDTLAYWIGGVAAIDPAGPYTECRASRWARSYMAAHGVEVPAAIWHVAVTEMHKEEGAWNIETPTPLSDA